MFTAGVVDSVEAAEDSVDVHTRDLKRLGSETPRIAIDLDARLTGFHPQDASLESVFRYLVERR
jgi:hypothetical protein